MGKLRVIKAGVLATVQDKGRFGFRKYGIPQSGAIDLEGMRIANQLVGNDEDAPVIEFALAGLSLEVLENTAIGVFGAAIKLNGVLMRESALQTKKGDILEIAAPQLVYAYLAVGGVLVMEKVYASYATYLPGKLGGMQGRSVQKEDVLQTIGVRSLHPAPSRQLPDHTIKFMKGPEWEFVTEPFRSKTFEIHEASNRIGVRLKGKIGASLSEIKSSAVVPGTIQLPPQGDPIVLMHDCQTTGGYPRIGKVLADDLGKLGQLRPSSRIALVLAAS